MQIRPLRLALIVVAAFAAGAVATTGWAWVNGRFDPLRGVSDGVAAYDANRVDGGTVLIAPLGTNEPFLLAKDGTIVHRWHLERPVRHMAELLPDRSLLYLAKAPDGDEGIQPRSLNDGWGLVRVSWDGKVMWSDQDPDLHHDFAALPDGTIASLKTYPLPKSFTQQIMGGAPGTEWNGEMWADEIVEIDPSSLQQRVVFDAARALKPAEEPVPEFLYRGEWTHANSLQYLPTNPIDGTDGYLISFRQLSTVAIVSRSTGKVVWRYGGPWVLDQQHDATMLDNGDVLLFDNGQYARNRPAASQVMEIDPRTDEVVWTYPAQPGPTNGFFSSIVSGAQRLPNGDTLITLGMPGKLMEVAPDGDVVWEFVLGSEHPLFKARSYPTSTLR